MIVGCKFASWDFVEKNVTSHLSALRTIFLDVLQVATTVTGGGGGDCWYGLGVGWVMGRERVSNEMGRITNGKVLAFGGVKVQLQITGPAGADV